MKTVKLKICGVRSADEAKQLLDAGVDYAGLNFIPSSTRYISLDTAEAIMAVFRGSSIKTVALFAGRPIDEVNDYARRLGVGYVQLHGDEPSDYARQVDIPVMRAIAVKPDSSADEIIKFIDSYPADYFVLDRPVQGQGDLINLDLARQVVSARQGKIFLAGGLTPDNLAGVLAQARPYGIDIAGGVRTGNDLDITKLAACLEILGSAG